jgi:hypothetical protein
MRFGRIRGSRDLPGYVELIKLIVYPDYVFGLPFSSVAFDSGFTPAKTYIGGNSPQGEKDGVNPQQRRG